MAKHTTPHDRDRSPEDPDQPANLLAFVRRFPDEEACEKYLLGLRWPEGFACPKCGVSSYYWLKSRRGVVECTNGHQTSLTAGTVMHRTKQPLTLWFYGAYLVSTLTPGISAVQFQRQLGIKRYETAFQLLHKLRSVMVAPGREPLHGEVEVDEAFIGGEQKGGKRGRGSENKTLVVVGVEIIRWVGPDPQHPDNPNAGVEHVRAGRVRMTVIPDAKAETLLPWVTRNVAKGSTIYTDGWPSYAGLSGLGYTHARVLQKQAGQPTGQYMPLVHLLISNLKRWLLGTHKGRVSAKHLQAYLNEFTFRFNRRFWRGPAFVRALGLSMDADDRPEYRTLYGTHEEKDAWIHPNPRVSLDDAEVDRLVDVIWEAAREEADEPLRDWMQRHRATTRASVRAALQGGSE